MTNTSGAVTPFVDELEQRKVQIKLRLPAHIDVDKFSAIVLTAASRNPDLARADRRSFWNAAMLAASDGLMPDGRQGAFVIFNTKEVQDGVERWIPKVQWMPMVEGIRIKARNSGEILSWESGVVHEADEFEYELGDEPFIRHKPSIDGNPGPVVAAYSICKYKNGETSREVMSRAEIDKARAISKSANKGPWVEWFGEMARKTVVHRHSKSIPLSSDLANLIHRSYTEIDNATAKDELKPTVEQRRRTTQADKLKALAAFDPQTGEIPMEKEAAPVEVAEEAKQEETKAPAEPKQRGPKSARKPSPAELMQAAGDAALAKGPAAFRQWEAALTEHDFPNITVAMSNAWKEALTKLEATGAQ